MCFLVLRNTSGMISRHSWCRPITQLGAQAGLLLLETDIISVWLLLWINKKMSAENLNLIFNEMSPFH